MDSNDDFDIDPAMAAAMGFSDFGQSRKKRKYDDGYIDPDIAKGPQGTSANNLPIGERKATKTTENIVTPSTLPLRPEPQQSGSQAPETGSDGKPTLLALRNGVRNDRGDLVIFLPSFIEDPWAGMKAQ